MRPVRIAVIGVGPRGLSAVERIVSLSRLGGPPVELFLVEPGELGVGIHRPEQPDYLLLNTICSQLTVFSDRVMVPGAPVTQGPSLYDWCRQRSAGVGFDDYLPRRRLGEYLRWAARRIVDGAPPRLTVGHRRAVAEDVRPADEGATVTLAGDASGLTVDLAIVTTGHGLPAAANAGDATLIASPYPLPEQVAGIAPGSTVALLGTGLTAMDVVAALTVGRDGGFARDSRGVRYTPSGREPKIVLANRSGCLPCARPAAREGRRAAPARFLTQAAVAALRRSGRARRLDFRRDVEPLIRREALSRMPGAPAAQRAAVVRALSPVHERWADHATFRSAILARAREDLREAEAGLGVSAVKEGLEVLRDHRDSLRTAIDAPGLTAESHRYFMTEYVSVVNRVVSGPQKERVHELLALIDAGVVALAPGPAPTLTRTQQSWLLVSTRLGERAEQAADVVICANATWPATISDRDPVPAALRRWCEPGPGGPSLGLDRDGFVLGADRPTVAVFGPPAEGASYYNHYVPMPGVWSRALTDLDRVIAPALAGDSRVLEQASS